MEYYRINTVWVSCCLKIGYSKEETEEETTKRSIPANVKYVPHPTEFGGNISCLPETSKIKPDSVKPFVILFYSEIEGNFLENLEFEILESGDILKCAIAGNVVCPQLKSIPHTLNFGTVSIGLDNELEFLLSNETPVAISFDTHVDDSNEKSIKFVIEPDQGTVNAHEEQTVKVTINCLMVCELRSNLIINMWNGKHALAIPIICDCSFPNVLCDPSEITIRFGFIGCPFRKPLYFKNLTDLPGYVEYVPDVEPNGKTIFCDVEPAKIFLKAKEATQVMLIMHTTSLGPQELPLLFDVGGGAIQTFCTVYINGQGPVVAVSPDEIDFGKITNLETFEKVFTLNNDTPIPALVKLHLKPQSMFSLDEEEFEMGPEEEKIVTVRACLNSTSKVTDTIFLDVDKGDKMTLKVSAHGIGSCVICEPRLCPTHDLGIILTYSKYSLPVKFLNKGTVVHKILVSQRQHVKSLKAVEDERTQSIFSVNPEYFEIKPDEEMVVSIKGTQTKPIAVEEKFFVFATLGKSNVIQTLFDFTLRAKFSDPCLEIDKSSLYFEQNIIGDLVEGKCKDQLLLNNVTGVNFDVVITSEDHNFQIINESTRTSKQTLKRDESLVTDVGFNPILNDKRKKSLTGRLVVGYVDHPKTDIVTLHGEVVFPTIRLLPNQVNFGSIPNASTTVRNIVINNISTLEVKFNWKWLEGSLVVNHLTTKKKLKKFPFLSSKEVVMEDAELEAKTSKYSELSVSKDFKTLSKGIPDSLLSTSVLLSYDDDRYSYEMKKVLCPILEFESENEDKDIEKNDYPTLTVKNIDKPHNEFLNYFALVPAEGTLPGNGYTTVAVGFHAPPDTEVSAVAVCKILGGEEEVLSLTGQSTHLSFMLDKESVEFGCQIFCEECTSEITLKNDGMCSYNYSIVQDELVMGKFEPGMLDINPKGGTLNPNLSITFTVKFFPGFPGEFQKSFVLEVGYLEAVVIDVHGYGVLSQVFLAVPRPGFHNDLYLTYKALSALTSDYLKALKKTEKPYNDRILDQTDFLISNDWTVVSYNDIYPELIDIDLCIERKMALRHIRKNKGILKEHTLKKKVPYIPDFCVPQYLVDFGFVVKERPVCYTIVILNYGPIKTEVKILENRKSTLNKNEFKIEFPNKALTLNVNELGQCYVLFTPTAKRYKEINETVEEEFHFAVKHGPIIPVKIKAVVTLPKVQLDHQYLDFGKIYCGECFRKTIVLTNSGDVPAKWYATIPPPTIKGQKYSFSVTPTEGELKAGKKCHLQIYFLSTTEGLKKSVIKLNVENNKEEIKLELKGECALAKLSVALPELNFKPTMSFFKDQMEFSVINESDVDVEFYFPEYDEEIELEKTLIDVYLKYKSLKKVYVPHMTAGQRLPLVFKNLYDSLLNKLKRKMTAPSLKFDMHSVHEDVLEKYVSDEIDDILLEINDNKRGKKACDFLAYIDAEGFEVDPEIFYANKSTCYKFDETSEVTEVIEPEPQPVIEPVERNAAILIFHGSPLTDYYKAANEAGIALDFPVYEIDRLIIEALLENTHRSSEDILNKINDQFQNIAEEEDNLKIELEESQYDRILQKINTILTYKPKKDKKRAEKGKAEGKKGNKQGSQATSPSGSEKSGKGKEKVSSTDFFLDISQDAFCDIIREKLKQFPTIIIESLNSIFVSKENLALYTILKAANYTKYINLILLSFTLKDYIKNKETKYKSEIEKNAPKIKLDVEEKKTVNDKKAKKGSDKKSSDKKSTKSSKSSKKEKSVDVTKLILKNLPKQLKAELENYEKLENEILHVCEYWDRKVGALKKPFVAKGAAKNHSTAKESSKSTKTSSRKLSSTALDTGLNPSELGIYFWIVLNSTRERGIDFSTEIKNSLIDYQELQEIVLEVKSQMEGIYEESDTLFSVISKVRSKKNTHSSEFSIKDFCEDVGVIKDDTSSIATVASKRRSESSLSATKKPKRKSSKIIKHTNANLSVVPILNVAAQGQSEDKFTTKLVLTPGEEFKYQVTFSPLKYGDYSQTYIVETVLTNTPSSVKCNAICYIPTIDLNPQMIFPQTVQYLKDKMIYDNFVYVQETNEFDFGSVIVSQNIEKSLTFTTQIYLKNISGFKTEIEVFLDSNAFTCEPTSFAIDSYASEHVIIQTKPSRIGTFTAEMYLSVKNNPQVMNFTISCTSCKLEFSVAPKVIHFDNVPVGQTAKRSLKLSNSSPMNLRWKIVEPTKLTDLFDVSEVCGLIHLYSISYVAIRFSPKVEEIIGKTQIQLEVYDVGMSTNDPFYTEHLQLSAESVEYGLEVNDHIDFGEVQSGIEHKEALPVINKAKCEIKIHIGLNDQPIPKDSPLEFFKVSPAIMTLGAMKTDDVQLVFRPTKKININKLPVFHIFLMDAAEEFCIISHKISVSAVVFMPKYSICPPRNINFGYVQLSSVRKNLLQIANKGKFPFNFAIVSYIKFLEKGKEKKTKGKKDKRISKGSDKSNSDRKKSKKSGTSKSTKSQPEKKKKDKKSEASKNTKSDKKSKKDKNMKSETGSSKNKGGKKGEKPKKITKLELGCFSIIPSSGTVNPNETMEISVEFAPQENKLYKEEIVLDIPEITDLKKKKVLALEGMGCEPKLNLDDFKSLFAEFFITKDLDMFNKPKKVEGVAVFVATEVAIYFKLVCVNTKKSVGIHVKNIGFVPANLCARIDDNDAKVFEVSPRVTRLEPYASCCLEVVFTPKCLDEIKGILEISYNASTDQKLTVHLIGKAHCPQVSMLHPVPDSRGSVIRFPPICVGHSKQENLKLRNVGVITAKTIVEVADDDTQSFQLLPSAKTFDMFNVKDAEESYKKNLVLVLEPNEEADFIIQYQPHVEQCVKVTVNIFTVNNPFETFKVIIFAESFDNDIIFVNLEAIKFDSPDSSNSSLIPKSTIGYLLDFGFAEINRLYKKSFFVENKAPECVYKFRFYANSVMFSPEVGHLKPGAKKEILAVFKTSKPVCKAKEEISCNICKIEYVHPNISDLSWDDRQKFVLWTTDNLLGSCSQDAFIFAPVQDKSDEITDTQSRNSNASVEIHGKIIMEGTEPEIISLSNSFEHVSILLNVVSDYSVYNCDTSVIEMPDTFITEKSLVTFDVENFGNVPFDVKWTITCHIPVSQVKRSNSDASSIKRNSIDSYAPEKLHSSSSCSSLLTTTRTDYLEIPLALTIMPTNAKIFPEQKQTFEVTFSPESESSYEFFIDSEITSLNPAMDTIHIDVKGKGLGIPFYFERENGQIMSKNDRFEFESVGCGTESYCSCYLVNRGEKHLLCEIIPQDLRAKRGFSYFTCKTPNAKVGPKRKSTIMFSFAPHILGTFMEQFVIKISEIEITRTLTLQGVCREPKIYFSEPSVYLNSTVAKVNTTKSLSFVNEEDFTVSFKFSKKTLFAEGKPNENIVVLPQSGKILPRSKVDLSISFCPKSYGINIFNVKCIVDKIRKHLNLHVTSESRRIEAEVTYVNKDGHTVKLSEETANVINFGNIIKGRQSQHDLKIVNNGETGLYYSFEFDPKPVAYMFGITLTNETGFLKIGESAVSNLCLQAFRLGPLKHFKIKLNISYGPSYLLHINAVSERPMFSFSFNEYHFGSCFIQNTNTKYYSAMLVFKNLDNKPLRLENCFQNTDDLTVDKFTAKTFSPGESKNIHINFHPQKKGAYSTELSFLINSIKHFIPIAGEGVPVNVQLLDNKDQFVDFEGVPIGIEKKYRVNFWNNSLAKMDVRFDWIDSLTVYSRKDMKLDKAELKIPVIPEPFSKKGGKDKINKDKGKKEKKEKKSKSTKSSGSSKEKKDKKDKKKRNMKSEEEERAKKEEELRLLKLAQDKLTKEAEENMATRKCFTIVPNGLVSVPPNGKSHFTITFKPTKRIIPFTDKIYFETQDHYGLICEVTASSIAPEFCLDKTTLTFPNVIVGNNTDLPVALKNIGDIYGRFSWTIDDRRNIFDIEPKQGFLMPHSQAKITVTFSPRQKKCQFKTTAKCKISELDSALELVLQGYAAEMPGPKETVVFECNVRSSIVKQIMITNPSTDKWTVACEISNKNFLVPNNILVEPQSECELSVRYCPKFMTKKDEPDIDILFLKLPTGFGEVYKLIGHSNPPQCVKRIEKEILCKSNHYENLVVENWLNARQTFKVTTELISPVTPKTLYKILGFKTTQVESKETKTYKWGIFAVNDQLLEFKVTFKNIKTGEYLFYEISLKVLASSPIKNIEFETTVRKALTKQIILENSVDVPVTFNLECAEKSITFEKLHVIEPYTKRKVDVTYTPLQSEEMSVHLYARTEELGTFIFNFNGKTSPPDPEDVIFLKCELGMKQNKVILFENTFGHVLEFTYKFQNEEYIMEKCNLIHPGDTGKIVISFEPSSLGILESQLTLSSSMAGDFLYNLVGEGTSPTPRGPVAIKSNQSTPIEFKNPFKEESKFIYHLHPDVFFSTVTEELLKSRKATRILVNIQPLQDAQSTELVTGKLTIYPEFNPNLTWTYFLQYNNK